MVCFSMDCELLLPGCPFRYCDLVVDDICFEGASKTLEVASVSTQRGLLCVLGVLGSHR